MSLSQHIQRTAIHCRTVDLRSHLSLAERARLLRSYISFMVNHFYGQFFMDKTVEHISSIKCMFMYRGVRFVFVYAFNPQSTVHTHSVRPVSADLDSRVMKILMTETILILAPTAIATRKLFLFVYDKKFRRLLTLSLVSLQPYDFIPSFNACRARDADH